MSESAAFQQAFGTMMFHSGRRHDPALERALAIHRNTATRAAIEALEDNYPVVRALLGEEPFAACASSFVDASPPGGPRLCVYGAGFSAFIDSWVPFIGAKYLSAVAALERLVTECLFAADAPVFDAAAFACDPDAEILLTPHPAMRLIFLPWPAASLWRAHQDDEPELDAIAWEPETALVTRPGGHVEVRAIDDATRAFLLARNVGEGAVAAAAAGGDVSRIFTMLLGAGAFADPSTPGVPS